jgi:signal transduction histidine kinase
LQSFQGVLLQLRAALRMGFKEPGKAQEVLTIAIDEAARAIKEGRDAVQGLRASAEEPNDLAASIARLGNELRAERGAEADVSVRVQADRVARPLHPIVRDEIFRIAAEALRNALAHSGAAHIEVELRYGPQQFRLSVRDDGRGIDPKILAERGRERHFGLRGMRERAELAGGTLTVWSAPDSGTEVELVISASKAYAAARRPHRERLDHD